MAGAIGEALREARIRRGIELGEVERVTKIKIKYLRAIEEEQWQLLPAPAYARGFLSTYARFLELDDRALVGTMGAGTGWSRRRGRSPSRCCPLVVSPGNVRGARAAPSWPA
jgi:Helix-turn-helix domain